jgi:hypothetical protein
MSVNKTKQFQKLGYDVPNGYFDFSKQRMLNHVLIPPKQKTIVMPLWKKFIEAAALIVLLLATKWSVNMYMTTASFVFSDYDVLLVESMLIEEEDFDAWFEENYVLNVH